MTQAVYHVGLDLNRDRYFPKGVAQFDSLNLIDSPQMIQVQRFSTVAPQPAYNRLLYDPDYNYYWSFSTGTSANAGMFMGQTDDFERGMWIPNGSQITVRLEFLGVANYTGEQLTFTVTSRAGTLPTTASTTVSLTGSWQEVSLTFTPDSEHLLITLTRITTLTNVTFWLRKLMIVLGSSAPTAYNTGMASDYYENIGTYVQSMSWNNGMDHYDQTVSGGSRASIVLDNRDGLFYQEDDLAANVLTNSEFTAWVNATTPTAWTGTNLSANAQTTQVGTDELHGGTGLGALNLYATSRVLVSCNQNTLTQVQRYKVTFSITASSGIGGVRFFIGNSQAIYPVSRIYTDPGVYTFFFTNGVNDGFFITNNRYPCDITIENVSVVPVPRYAGIQKEALVTIRATDSGSTEYQMWTGRIVKITPDGGRYAMRTVTLECVDAMEEFGSLEYRPGDVLSANTPATNLTIMFVQLELIWPYAKDYWMLGTSFLGVDSWLFDGATISTYSAADELTIDYATASASNSKKGISASAFARDIMALEIGGRFYINARTGKFEMYSHNWDPSIISGSSITDDDFDSFEMPYAEDVLNTITIWYKQKRLGSGNVVLWSSSQPITVSGKSKKTVTGRYFDPTNAEINVSAISTEAFIRNFDYAISPDPNNPKVNVTADAGATSVSFTIENDRQIDIEVTTLQIRGFPLYALTEESITVQNADSLYNNNTQKQDYNMPLISDSDTAIAIATGLTTMRGDPIDRLQSITFVANKSDARYSRALATTIGLHYTITSSLLGHSKEYVVIGERHSVSAGGDHTHTVTWVLAPVELFNYWILGQAGRSELGSTTIPIY